MYSNIYDKQMTDSRLFVRCSVLWLSKKTPQGLSKNERTTKSEHSVAFLAYAATYSRP
jgi:hypothetical protein